MGMFFTVYKGGAVLSICVKKNVCSPNNATTLVNGASVLTVRSADIHQCGQYIPETRGLTQEESQGNIQKCLSCSMVENLEV